ncbi:hypothetical protein LTR28_011804 [Elasticomyces elasticus]|nr:hypothetical protein LTR28_011804 [Elasticomyces elasticus]
MLLGGYLRPDLYGHIPTYIDRHGVDAGAELTEFEVAHVQAIKELIAEEDIDCDFSLTRTIDVWCNEAAAQKAKATYEMMMARKLSYMDNVHFVYGERAEGLVLHLLKSVIATGAANVQTYTPVTAVAPVHSDGWSVITPRGSIHTANVVHAQNAYVPGLLPEYVKNIVPCKGICCHITVPVGTHAPLLNNSYINRDTDGKGLSYLIPRADGCIIVGGASHLFRPFEEQWYNNIDDSVLIDAVKGSYDGYMQRTYHGWEESRAYVSKMWTRGKFIPSFPFLLRLFGTQHHAPQ